MNLWESGSLSVVFGRLTAQFGTGVQPMRFEYNEANRVTALHTWRVPQQEMSLSVALRADAEWKMVKDFEFRDVPEWGL